MNTLVPVLVLCIAYSSLRQRTALYLSKMREAISQLELKNVLKMIPQAIFLIDDATEEVLHESDAMMALFGQTVENILSERIFEAKRVTKGNSFIEQDEQDAEASIPDKKEEINAIVVEPEETARTVNTDGPAKILLKTDSAPAANNIDRFNNAAYINNDERYEGGSNTENTEINNRRERRSLEEDK